MYCFNIFPSLWNISLPCSLATAALHFSILLSYVDVFLFSFRWWISSLLNSASLRKLSSKDEMPFGSDLYSFSLVMHYFSQRSPTEIKEEIIRARKYSTIRKTPFTQHHSIVSCRLQWNDIKVGISCEC